MGTENSELRVDIRTSGREQLDQIAQALRVLEQEMLTTNMTVERFDALQSAQKGLLQEQADLHKKIAQAIKEHEEAQHKLGDAAKEFGEHIRQHITTPLGTAYLSVGQLAEGFGPLGVGILGAVGVIAGLGFEAFESAKKLGELGTQINNVSIRTGLSTKEVSLFSFAARAAGSDIGSFETAMKMFSRALSDNSDEGKKAKQQLDDMGIKTRDLTGALRPVGELFLEISDALNKMGNSADRATAAQLLFSRAGIELLPTLLKLRENLEFAKEHNVEFFSPDQIAKMEEYHKRVLLIEDTWGKIWHAIAGASVAAAAFIIDLPGDNPQGLGGAQRGAIRQMGVDRVAASTITAGNLGAGSPSGALSPEGQAAARIALNNRMVSAALSSGGAGEEDKLASQISAARKDVLGAEGALQTGVFPEVNAAALKNLATARATLATLLAQNAALEEQKRIQAERAASAKRTLGAENALLPPAARIIAERDQELEGTSDPFVINGINQAAQFRLLALNQQAVKAAMSGINTLGAQVGAGTDELGQAGKRSLAFDTRQFETGLKTETKENSEALKNLEKTLKEVDAEQEKREAERRRQVDQFSGGLFDALLHGPGGVGSFFKGQALDQARTIFQNVGQLVAPAITSHIPQVGGALGGIFKGTAFGGTTDPSVKLNSSAVALTSAAVALKGAAAFLRSGRVGTGAGGMGATIPDVSAGGDGASADDGTYSHFPGEGDPSGSGGTAADNASIGADPSALGTALKVAGYAGAAYGAYKGITTIAKGGGRNVIGGIGEIAGAAAAVDPEPISKAILAGVALGATVITAIMGDPRANRANQEANGLKFAHFFDPVARNIDTSTGGTFADYDRSGNIRTSPFSPFAPVQEPFADYRHNTFVPGRTGNIGSNAPPVTINISTLDGASLHQYVQRNSDIFANGLVKAIGDGHPVTPKFREALLGV